MLVCCMVKAEEWHWNESHDATSRKAVFNRRPHENDLAQVGLQQFWEYTLFVGFSFIDRACTRCTEGALSNARHPFVNSPQEVCQRAAGVCEVILHSVVGLNLPDEAYRLALTLLRHANCMPTPKSKMAISHRCHTTMFSNEGHQWRT